jgi:hypothetical protein
MADILRIVELRDDASAPRVIINLSDAANVFPVRDSFSVTAPQASSSTVQPGGRWGGERVVSETHGNASIVVRLLVRGSTKDDSLGRISALMAATDRRWRGWYVEWRPDGATRSTFYEMRAAAQWELGYRWIIYQATGAIELGLTIPVAPLALGPPMDVYENFDPRGSIQDVNGVRNPSLEYTALDWSISSPTGTPTGTRVTTEGLPSTYGGGASYELSVTGMGVNSFSQIYLADSTQSGLAVSEGDVVYLQMTGKITAQAAASQSMQLLARALDGNGVYSTQTVIATQGNPATGTTYTLSGWYTVPAGSGIRYITPTIWIINNAFTGGTYTFRADTAFVVKVPNTSTAPTYFDGDTGGSWLGTPGESQSATYTDSALADFTVEAGSLTTLTTSSGLLKTTLSGSAPEYQLLHTGRGYTHTDGQYSIKATPGSINGFKAGRYWKAANGAYLEVYVDDNGTNSRLMIDKVSRVGGARINLAGTNLAGRIVAGTPFWVRLRKEANLITAEHFTSEPTSLPGSAPTTTINTILSAADSRLFGWGAQGTPGLTLAPKQSFLAAADDYRDEPYTFPKRSTPEDFDLLGIPGDAPALVNVFLGSDSSSNLGNGRFGVLGWSTLPTFNMIHNGDAENPNNASWLLTNTAQANINAAATSITRTSDGLAYRGGFDNQVVTPGTVANEGFNGHYFHRFRKGQPYTFSAWVRTNGAQPVLEARLGNSAANDVATGTAAAINSNSQWQQFSVTWTPTADRDDAHFTIRTNGTTAVTYFVDAMNLYEGTVPPTTNRHAEGIGALPPIGVAEFEWQNTATTDANARGGFITNATLPNGGTSGSPSLYFDPSLIVPDDFQDDLAIELFARVMLPTSAVAPFLFVQAQGYAGPNASTPVRYTQEYGSTGVAVSTSSSFQIFRAGTIVVPAESIRQRARWIIQLVMRVSAGSSGTMSWDYMFLVPATDRATNPTGKDGTTVPLFFTNSSQKRIRSDLTTTITDPTITAAGEVQSAGLGGSLLEMEPGNSRIVALFAPEIPNDPARAAVDTTVASKAVSLHASITPRFHVLRG